MIENTEISFKKVRKNIDFLTFFWYNDYVYTQADFKVKISPIFLGQKGKITHCIISVAPRGIGAAAPIP